MGIPNKLDTLRTKEECNRIPDISQYKLQSKVVNPESAAKPAQYAVDGCDKGQNDKHICPG